LGGELTVGTCFGRWEFVSPGAEDSEKLSRFFDVAVGVFTKGLGAIEPVNNLNKHDDKREQRNGILHSAEPGVAAGGYFVLSFSFGCGATKK
jgi:hypothetical protein